MNVLAAALALSMTIGIMGIITPFATGPGPIYAGSGYLPAEGLLAAWHALWRDQPAGVPRRWRPLVALGRVTQDQRRRGCHARHQAGHAAGR